MPILLVTRNYITALDDSDLPLERRQKFEKDAQIMLTILPPQIEALKKEPPLVAPSQQQPDKKPTARDQGRSEINEHVDFERTAAEGRFAVARDDIAIGERVLAERPHCAVLLESFAATHCQQCFRRAGLVPLPCDGCADVVFCSPECRQLTAGSYHRYECGMLRILWNSGTSVTCHMALRAIAQQSVGYFRGLEAELRRCEEDPGRVEREVVGLPVADYRRVYLMERHERVRSGKSFLNYAAMAYFLTHCLRMGGFFADVPEGEAEKEFDFIGALVLRNLQVMQFNSHEVYELRKDGAKTVFLGGGLYPTLGLFNHSCNPGIVR